MSQSEKIPVKIEVTEEYVRVPNPKFSGECNEIKTIEINDKAGILALWCVTNKTVKTYLFDKTKWTVSEAQDWVNEHAKDLQNCKTTAQTIKEGKEFLAVASEEMEDREGDVIAVDGWDFKSFKQNPVMLWMHNRVAGHNGLPIGHVEKIGYRMIDGKKKLVFKPVFDDSTDFNRTVKKFYEEGVMSAFSVGFLPKDWEDGKILKQELLEISAVPVPALNTALVISRAQELGVTKEMALKTVEEKGAVPYRAYSPAPESKTWDGAGAVAAMQRLAGGPDKDKVNWGEYKEGFAWFDQAKSDSFGAYKLPHHDVEGGKLVTVWKGVVAAMAALLGARGGVDLPEADRRKVYNHLAEHYKQFDKVAPDYKAVESQELKELFDIYTEMIKEKVYGDAVRIMKDIKGVINDMRKEEKPRTKQVDSTLVAALVLKGLNQKLIKTTGKEVN